MRESKSLGGVLALAAADLLDEMRRSGTVRGSGCVVARSHDLSPDLSAAIMLAAAERIGAVAVMRVIVDHIGRRPDFGRTSLREHMAGVCSCPKR